MRVIYILASWVFSKFLFESISIKKIPQSHFENKLHKPNQPPYSQVEKTKRSLVTFSKEAHLWKDLLLVTKHITNKHEFSTTSEPRHDSVGQRCIQKNLYNVSHSSTCSTSKAIDDPIRRVILLYKSDLSMYTQPEIYCLVNY